MERCPFDGCNFMYDPKIRNDLKTHKRLQHVPNVIVLYTNPSEQFSLVKVEEKFHCVRCSHSTSYPNVIQKHARQCKGVPAIPAIPPRSPSPIEVDPVVAKSSPAKSSPGLSYTSPSPSCSPPGLSSIDNSDYSPFPAKHTVIHHPPFNLPALGISIDLRFHVIICMTCQRAIDCNKMIDHLRKDLPLVDIPANLPTVLQSAYDLVAYSNVVYSVGSIIPVPVFGLLLHEEPLFFCACGKGYSTYETLRVHQTRQTKKPCPFRETSHAYHIGYGQRFTANRSFFEVDIAAWKQVFHDDDYYRLVYRQSFPPPRQYSQMEINGAEDEMNTSSFFFTQRWLHHLKGYTPADILEVCNTSTPEVPYAELLREVAENFLLQVNEAIRGQNTFGLLQAMGQTTDRPTNHRFDPVLEGTAMTYAVTLYRMVFSVLRQTDESYSHKYRYPPLDPIQLAPLIELRQGLVDQLPLAQLHDLFQTACFYLFAHHQHQYDTSRKLDQFFSPVICFLVVYSVREGGGFHVSSTITQYIAHMMFSSRGVMLFEVTRKSDSDRIGVNQAYESFRQYLTNGHETPMAYYYNVSTLLVVMRVDEVNQATFSCTDGMGREFSYRGNIIKVANITQMIEALYNRYVSQSTSICFFDEPTPPTLRLEVEIEDIIDDLQNSEPGYSFLDDPRNDFDVYRSRYGEWLLSDPERATNFVYIHDGRIIWKPGPCLELLRKMRDLRQILLLLCIFSAGPSSRATEVARQLLRNVPGSYRNLLVLFHVVCLVDIQDKTSHKHLKDKYVPHCPTREVTTLLLHNLAVFRPFEEHLVQEILGDVHGLRYHQQLWPDLKETISDTRVSDSIGKECTLYLTNYTLIGKVSYKILFWRNLVTAILKRQPNATATATHDQYYIDTAMMHSTNMAIARYGGDTANLPMSDPRQVVECIKVGLLWHKLLNIGQANPLSVNIDKQLEKLESSNYVSTVSTNATLSSTAISTISNTITEIVGSRLEHLVQETVMKAMAEMSHLYFPKVVPNHVNDLLDTSQFIVPSYRLAQLRDFLQDPCAEFSCPEQAILLELMMRREQSVLGILGTGLGKTLVVLMQAKLNKGLVTIMILPLSSLHDDLRRRAFTLGVSYSRWNPNGKFNNCVSLISVSIEHLGFPSFLVFIAELENQHRLGPFVFDEIQKLITDFDYRQAFQNFHVLHKLNTIVIALSGSIPPSLYPVLCELTQMTWKVLRTPSSRKELKYQVVRVKTDAEMDPAIISYFQLALKQYRAKDRGLIFCRTKNEAQKLAKRLNVDPYHAVLAEEQDRNTSTMDKWLSGEEIVMVSTSILGCGFDYGSIRDVVHRGPAYTMLDQYQEDSRGGRDGLECRATTFIVEKKKYPISQSPYDLGTRILYDSLDEREKCMRTGPTLYLDGQVVQCITLRGAAQCANCDCSLSSIDPPPRHSPLPPPPPPPRHFPLPPPPRHSPLPPPRHSPSPPPPPRHSPPRHLSPPNRVPDVFDRPRHIDLLDVLKPRRDSSRSQTLSQPSPTKKRKLTDSSALAIRSPGFRAPFDTPASPIVALLSSSLPRRSSVAPLPLAATRHPVVAPLSSSPPPRSSVALLPIPATRHPIVAPLSSSLPPRSSVAPLPIPATRHRPVQPAGISARQHVLSATEREIQFRSQVVDPTVRAFEILKDKCIMCWMTGEGDWNLHISDDCNRGLGTNKYDQEYTAFRGRVFKLPEGWCWFCYTSQRKPFNHPSCPAPKDCPWKGIIVRVIYMYTRLNIPCPFLPADVNIADIQKLRQWLSTDPKEYIPYTYHNGLKLFLWVISSPLNLLRDYAAL